MQTRFYQRKQEFAYLVENQSLPVVCQWKAFNVKRELLSLHQLLNREITALTGKERKQTHAW